MPTPDSFLFDLGFRTGAALLLAAGATLVMERLALRWDVVDRPTQRKHHRRTTPLLGGVAIFLAFWVVTLLFEDLLFGDAGTSESSRGWQLAFAATLVMAVGLWDDVQRLSVSVRLAAQLVAALTIVATGSIIDLPVATWLAGALTVLWIVAVTNALNLLDNLDGAASTVTAVAGVFLAGVLLIHGEPGSAGLAAVLTGAALGFLMFNYSPARLFMGDAGSLFLGLLLAYLAIETQRSAAHSAGWIPPVLILGLALFDTTLVMISRLRRGKNPLTTPGRDHFAHRLLRLGWSERRTVLVLGLLGTLLGIVAVLADYGGASASWGAGAVVFVVGVVALVWLERLSSVTGRDRSGSEGRAG